MTIKHDFKQIAKNVGTEEDMEFIEIVRTKRKISRKKLRTIIKIVIVALLILLGSIIIWLKETEALVIIGLFFTAICIFNLLAHIMFRQK